MRKLLFLALSLVGFLFFLSCDNGDMDDDSNKVTVTFETFEGIYIEPIRVRTGTAIGEVLPKKDPKKQGFEFVGWFRNENFETKISDSSISPVTSDIKLFAKFANYYPHEVSNISHTFNRDEWTTTVTWTNPEDENFSHVRITYGQYLNGGIDINPGDNSRIFIISMDTIWLKCIDIHGNLSKGVQYRYSTDFL